MNSFLPSEKWGNTYIIPTKIAPKTNPFIISHDTSHHTHQTTQNLYGHSESNSDIGNQVVRRIRLYVAKIDLALGDGKNIANIQGVQDKNLSSEDVSDTRTVKTFQVKPAIPLKIKF